MCGTTSKIEDGKVPLLELVVRRKGRNRCDAERGASGAEWASEVADRASCYQEQSGDVQLRSYESRTNAEIAELQTVKREKKPSLGQEIELCSQGPVVEEEAWLEGTQRQEA